MNVLAVDYEDGKLVSHLLKLMAIEPTSEVTLSTMTIIVILHRCVCADN